MKLPNVAAISKFDPRLLASLRERAPDPVHAAAVLAPVLAVVLVRFVGAGPGSAAAAGAASLPSVPEVVRDWNPDADTARALDRVRDLVGRPIAANLLQNENIVEPIRPVAAATPTSSVQPIVPTIAIRPPDLKLTTVLDGRSGPIAVIDGRPRQIGQEVAPGWTLTHIDAKLRTVSLRGPSDTVHELRLLRAH